jgi:hypothetical protein
MYSQRLLSQLTDDEAALGVQPSAFCTSRDVTSCETVDYGIPRRSVNARGRNSVEFLPPSTTDNVIQKYSNATMRRV